MKLSEQATMTIAVILMKSLTEEANVQDLLEELDFVEEEDGQLYCTNPPVSIKMGDEENADL